MQIKTMQDIIERKFDEWTKDLSPEENRISIFEKIRDIPFAVVPEFFDFEKDPAGLLVQNRGFCVPKHYLLGKMYQKLEIPVRYYTYSFKWSDLDVDYPLSLRKLTEEIPVTYHLACKAFLNGRWVLVDATWDFPLKKTGFPVNERWDGRSDTRNAVKPLEEFAHESAGEREEAFKAKMRTYSLREKLILRRFSGGLNKWLESVRD